VKGCKMSGKTERDSSGFLSDRIDRFRFSRLIVRDFQERNLRVGEEEG
jgi:hypothetical protein